jgi:hypothetical protein
MTILLKAPLEFVAVKFSITAVVHASENNAKTTNAMNSTSLQDNEDLINNLTWGLSCYTKYWIDIWVVSAAFSGDE